MDKKEQEAIQRIIDFSLEELEKAGGDVREFKRENCWLCSRCMAVAIEREIDRIKGININWIKI